MGPHCLRQSTGSVRKLQFGLILRFKKIIFSNQSNAWSPTGFGIVYPHVSYDFTILNENMLKPT